MNADRRGFGDKFKKGGSIVLVDVLARTTSAAKAEGFAGWQRRAEALLHPVGGYSFEEAAEDNFHVIGKQELTALMNDRRGLGRQLAVIGRAKPYR